MEIEVSSSNPMSLSERNPKKVDKDQVRITRKTLQAVLERSQITLDSLNNTDGDVDGRDFDGNGGAEPLHMEEELRRDSTSTSPFDPEAVELCDLLKSRVECADFLEKLECAQVSPSSQNIPEVGSSWNVVSENDIWGGENVDSDQDDYVLVRQEDIVEGIANFMAEYLLSLKQAKGKLQKAWDGSKVTYNVASWGATANGIYQSPVLLKAASKAFWTSCHVISKLLCCAGCYS